mgnify:CR=1 FL=1
MKLCGDLSLLLIRLELVLDELFDDLFSENLFFWFFLDEEARPLHVAVSSFGGVATGPMGSEVLLTAETTL